MSLYTHTQKQLTPSFSHKEPSNKITQATKFINIESEISTSQMCLSFIFSSKFNALLRIWLCVLFSVQAQVLVISQNLACDSSDLRGLAGFMNALESPIEGWWPVDSSSPYCCNWIGITCNPSSGRIVKLELPDKGLVGQFSDSVSYLDQLKTLNLSHNFLKGQLPTSLFHLATLESLDLSSNYFDGVLPVTINLPALQVLDISSNRFSGNLPDFFDRFPKLSYFSAHSNDLSGLIPPSLLNSRTISSLNLSNNSLEGSIDFNCSMMVNLTSVNLGSNKFSGTIPENLAYCPKLKALNLARNKLTGQIPKSFKNFESLSYLSLSNCSFSDLSSSLKILQHCPNLTVLVLTMNFYSEQLPTDDVLQFKALKALVIANCGLTGSIPTWLNSLAQLQLLDLSFNHLTGMIPAYLGDFKHLFYLDLSNNSLSGEIPKNITQLESMISKDILLEEPSPDFPLFKKRLQYNHIIRFPPFVDLSYNLLTGPLWPEFGNMKKLHVLNLKHNKLSGMIPSSLSGMRSIERLDLSYNKLTGTIPPSLVKLNFLSYFSVAYNNLNGIIPTDGQFSTFSNSSFEGNPGLCGYLFVNCQTNVVLSQSPAFEDEDDDDEFSMPVLTGFGAGFLLTIISLLVVPRIKSHYMQNG